MQSALLSSSTHPLRLLSLDGGGVKGYVSLLILQSIFRSAGLAGTPPCRVFDLIGGTSTGGLIAIMLGRLGMTIEECMKEYETLSKEIFAKRSKVGLEGVRKGARLLVGMKFYDIKVLESTIKGVVGARFSNQEQCRLDAPLHRNGCHVMVCVSTSINGHHDVFRSYPAPSHQTPHDDILLHQAGCATAAAPFYFAPVKYEGSKWTDGGTTRNNPVAEVVSEAKRLWKGREIGCLLSVGCMVSDLQLVKPGVSGFAIGAMHKITDAELIRADFEAREGEEMRQKGVYFRFSVTRAAIQVKLDDWQMGNMRQFAAAYLTTQSTIALIEECVEKLGVKED